MSDTVIRVENLSKRYLLGSQQNQSGYNTLRDAIVSGTKSVGRKLVAPFSQCVSKPDKKEEFWALKDVSFEVKQGEIVGIIGRNGAGKSTLLKILSRITEPTSGRISIKGRVASLLEVGTGFHPELTGRENIFLNGAILGMSRVEIKSKFDEIVAFAEVEKFLDTPVKHYSSGMYVRLAFAVAAHLEPEILIVDEVLAVGDMQFQKKCLGKMGEVSTKEGRTVLFVSHNMAIVAKLCKNLFLFQDGELISAGDSGTVIQKYVNNSSQGNGKNSGINLSRRQYQSESVVITDAWLQRGEIKTDIFFFGDKAELILIIDVLQPIEFGVELLLRDSYEIPIAFSPSGLSQNCEFNAQSGQIQINCKLPPMQLAEGKYFLDLMLAKSAVKFFDYLESAICFTIEKTSIGSRNWDFMQSRGQGSIYWDVRYKSQIISEVNHN